MPSDGSHNPHSSQQEQDSTPLDAETDKQELVSNIRDSLAPGASKTKAKSRKDKEEREAQKAGSKSKSKPKAKKAILEPKVSVETTFERPKPAEESKRQKSEKQKAQKAFVRPKVDYRFSVENRDKRNFRDFTAHRKVTSVEYEEALKRFQKNRIAARREAIQDRGSAPEYSETDYIRLKKEAAESVKPVRFRALRAHRTTLIVISSFLFFEFVSLFRSKEWRKEAYKPLLKRNGQRIYKNIVKIQGLFVKFGQMVSIMSFAVPEDFRKELETLQDKVPQRPVENIIKRIESDLGRPIDRVFSHFNAEAIAAASLAQVHDATLVSGERVAVKVQHIGVEQEVKADLRTFNQISKIADFFLNINGLREAQDQITESIMSELDYAKEEKNLAEFYENYKGQKHIHIPKVYSKYCSEHVLVMDYVEGIKANDYKKLDELDIDRKLVARRIIEAFCQMVFKDGLIHGDPHPGNILVNDDASITMIDFGSVVELNPIIRQGVIDLVFGGLTRNTRRIMSGLRKVKYLTPQADEGLVERLIDYTYDFLLEGGLSLENFSLENVEFDKELVPMILKDLHHLDISYREIQDSFQLPEDVMLMSRMLMMLGGLVYEIDPQIKPFDVIRPYLQKFIISGSGDWQSTVRDNVFSVGMGALQTVDNARYVIDKAKRGELQINVKDERKRRYLHYYLFQQFVSMLLASGTGAMAYTMWVQGEVLPAQLTSLVTCGLLWSAVRATKSAKKFRR